MMKYERAELSVASHRTRTGRGVTTASRLSVGVTFLMILMTGAGASAQGTHGDRGDDDVAPTSSTPASDPASTTLPSSAGDTAPIDGTEDADAAHPVDLSPSAMRPADDASTPAADPAATGGSGDASIAADVGNVRVVAGLREGVRVEAPDAADFVFEVHFAAWARAVVDVPVDGQAQDYFEVPLVRPLLQASVFDGLFQLLVQPELAGPTPRLLDLHLDFVLDPAFRVRVGQFRTPMSRAYITPIIQLQMPDRGLVSDTFRADRQTGLMVFGAASLFEYALGVFNGSGIDGRIGDTPAPMVVGRVQITPYGSVPYDQTPSLTSPNPSGLAIGLDGFYRELNIAAPGDPAMNQQTATGGIDFSLVEGPFTFFAEGYGRGQSLAGSSWTPSWGAFAQAGIFIIPQIFEVSARADFIDPDTEQRGDLVQTYEANLAGYFYFEDVAYGNHLKLNLRYRFADTRDPFGPLPAGSSHQVTAQLQVWM